MKRFVAFALVLSSLFTLPHETLAANSCIAALDTGRVPNFEINETAETAVFRSLYYNRRRMQKNGIINLRGEDQVIVDWYIKKSGGKYIKLRSLKTGEEREYSSEEFPKGAVRIKETRLADLFNYKYDHPVAYENVIKRTMRDNPWMDRATSERAFHELMKWFFVKYRAEVENLDDMRAFMYNEIDTIDYSWHAFLLFTVDYRKLGEKYFGSYLEHTPGSGRFDPEQVRPIFYQYVRETLGEETYQSWFVRQDFNPHKNK